MSLNSGLGAAKAALLPRGVARSTAKAVLIIRTAYTYDLNSEIKNLFRLGKLTGHQNSLSLLGLRELSGHDD